MSTKVKITPAKPTGNVPLGTLSIKLTVREAEALSALCQRIGGNPTESARGLFDDIRAAMSDMGIDVLRTADYIESTFGSRGGIHFKNYSETRRVRA